MDNYIGIDLGGTNLRVARVSKDSEIEDIIRVESEIEKGTDQVVDKICDAINKLKNDKTKGVGLSVPGQVDVDRGIIIVTTNIPFDNEPIGDIINERCGLKTILNNDANVAGLGEAIKGSGIDSELIYYVTWSTGIGGALIINNKIINGKHMYTGEIGNLIIHSKDQYKHSIMVPGALEGLTSGTALKRYAVDLGYENAGELIEAYKLNDPEAVSLIDYVADNFARALAAIYHVVEVDLFIIGGGVTIKSGEILLPLVKQKINNYVMNIVKDEINITTAALGDDAGIYGAAYLAHSL